MTNGQLDIEVNDTQGLTSERLHRHGVSPAAKEEKDSPTLTIALIY